MADPKPFRRPPSLSAPSELGLGLGGLNLHVVDGAGSPRESSLAPLIPVHEGGGSPLATGASGRSPSDGASSPLFYTAPLGGGVGSPRPARPSFVGGGLLGRGAGFLLPQSLSLGRLEHAAPPPPPLALRVPSGAAPLAVAAGGGGGKAAAPAEGGEHDCCSGPSCCEAAHVWAMRFALHIVLLSVFETLFFWLFVGPTEDKSLLDLVNRYLGGTLGACPKWNATERLIVGAFLGLLLNRTEINRASAAAARKRTLFNAALLRNSWLYVAGLALLFLLLSAFSVRRRGGVRSLPWKVIFFENVALITMLGLYELMFFSSVVLPYQAVSVPEIDALVLREVDATCFPNATWPT